MLTREVVRAQSNSSSGSSTKYRTTYRFQTHTGDMIEATDDVDVDVWEALEEQGPVKIEYVRSDPDTNRVAGTSDMTAAFLFTGMGGLFSLIGGGALLHTVRRKREEARLRREGMRATGTVVAVAETNFTVNRVTQWRMRYRYRDHQGREHEGESGLLTPDEAAGIHNGATGHVRYDRNRPERSVWLDPLGEK